MPIQKRPFYIMGHNPNSVAEAQEYLALGANAIEPDIVYHNQQFYVSHNSHLSYKGVPTLESYLLGIKELLLQHSYDLALIVFDMKQTDFDINLFLTVVKANFSDAVCKGIAILVTHPDNTGFLLKYNGNYDDVGIGVDGTNMPVAAVEQLFKQAGQKNFSYSDGIIAFLHKPRVASHIYQAKVCQQLNGPESFKLIYAWVLEKESSMKQYLNHYIDGIMVDTSGVGKLKNLLTQAPYAAVYRLAQKGHNPFTAPRIPKYYFTITTANKRFAGTDANIVFTLKNALGETLKSLPFDADVQGALERGTKTFTTVDGGDLGEITSLGITLLDGGIAAGWLPETIVVESPMLKQKLVFVYSEEDWLTAKDSTITKNV